VISETDWKLSPSPFDERSGSPRDEVLDGWRAIAVLAVIAGHAINFRLAAVADAAFAPLHQMSGSAAVTGVQIFFLISGYVITRLLAQELRTVGWIELRAFYLRRATRILPPFGVYLLMVLILSYAGYIDTKPKEVAAAGMFACNTGIFECSWFVGHSWSLAVEEQFYLLWPMLLIMIRPRWVMPFLALAIIAFVAISFQRVGFPFANETSFLFIVIGSLTALSFGLQRAIVSYVNTPVWLAAVATFLAATLYASDAAMIILKPLLLMIAVFGAGNSPFVSYLMKSRLLQVIGACSYSLYLWQQLFLAPSTAYMVSPPSLLLLPIVVWLSREFIEKWGIVAGRALSKRKGAIPMAQATPV
jgi:peptidoglycan/LPS O-acetylase OafA/YrhL